MMSHLRIDKSHVMPDLGEVVFGGLCVVVCICVCVVNMLVCFIFICCNPYVLSFK